MSRFAVGLCLLAASLALEPATAQQSAANTMPRNPSFTATLSNTTPLVFGMDVKGVSRALGQPLSYISGRAGDEIYLAFRNNGGRGLLNHDDRQSMQLRKCRF